MADYIYAEVDTRGIITNFTVWATVQEETDTFKNVTGKLWLRVGDKVDKPQPTEEEIMLAQREKFFADYMAYLGMLQTRPLASIINAQLLKKTPDPEDVAKLSELELKKKVWRENRAYLLTVSEDTWVDYIESKLSSPAVE